jgi:peptidoglycan/xylan/chitin deacetylase (PgdA/CDA1 family)
MRLIAKRAVEIGLCRSGLPRLHLRRHRGDVLVLAYHNVVPDSSERHGDSSLHIGQERFRRQLHMLSRTHQFTTVERIEEQGGSRPRVAITFDDAYRGTVQLGVEVLRELGVPGTIFVPPGCLGGQRLWWDVLAGERGLDPPTREKALWDLRGKGEDILAWAGSGALARDVSDLWTTATEGELETALAYDGLTLGSHTWSHPNLAALDGPELDEELVRPLEWLRGRFPRRIAESLTYPYGEWSDTVVDAAKRAGYARAFRIEGGWATRKGSDPFRVPRLNVPAGLSLHGLVLRASGLLQS